MKKSIKYLLGGLFAATLALVGVLGFGQSQTTQAASKTVTIGIITGTKQDDAVWKVVSQTAKQKYGITLKFQKFTDYNQPNKALASGEIDLNSFQHYAFLNAWNKSNKSDLTPIGKTIMSPIRLYSTKIKNVKSIKKGDTITVPNDASNESRALFLLKNAGLITLKSNSKLVTIKDIAKNPKNLNIKEVDASQTARSLSDAAAAVVNGSYVKAAKLSTKDAIYTEPVNKDSEQWINIIVARKKDKNNKTYQDVVKAYQTAKTKKEIKAQFGNLEYGVWDVKIK
ncbi:D-methionine ABC transporter binding protein [Agrilactobacillus composti DSM 18527 = JCM 14202]|uniref:Lipoprotein n=1 Tax=Agrilactobacillus composti DSM 18527 = JCM 14202 TaxID=1423734 RepID=X0PE73_9LACO|nr:MetQ/NlpA family ABC transporter substrate-binding protein [Agrilactobacillus composti]KRM30812.1 D-methionine ABC transporter binding protein [Agrilactobacillus composti DSM 18527 = JCM 14202]GAF39809.1 methionine ABC transporter substrate-binding protein [Agrilactobacillus composti DSM 18527 = JCM 14202]